MTSRCQQRAVLDVLIQSHLNARVAERLMHQLLKKQGYAPRVVVTDKLRSYGAAFTHIGLGSPAHGAEQSCRDLASVHAGTRESHATIQIPAAAAAHDPVANLFLQCRCHTNANFKRTCRSPAFAARKTASDAKPSGSFDCKAADAALRAALKAMICVDCIELTKPL